MQFPMSNNRLKSVINEVEEYSNKLYTDNIVNQIKLRIIGSACNCRDLRSAYDTRMDNKLAVNINQLGVDNNRFTYEDRLLMHIRNGLSYKPSIPEIISKIQQLFPDMKITVDPLETYILFDWS